MTCDILRKKRHKEKLNSRVKISNVREIEISPDKLVTALLNISKQETVCLLDSCGISYLGSHLLIAGMKPAKTLEITNKNAEKTLEIFNEKLSQTDLASIFTISYDFGLKLENIKVRKKEFPTFDEPDIFLALFDCLVIHDYDTKKTFLTGNKNKFDEIEKIILNPANSVDSVNPANSIITSNFTRAEYFETIEEIKEFIRQGDTYQTNLTQQLRAKLPDNLTPQEIFRRLRENHPAPFSAFLKRKNDFVISASPERFFKVQSPEFGVQSQIISTSPIKGTRPRGKTPEEDLQLKTELLNSEKDRAENVMIVDLLRNDLGRICKFGTVKIEKLCDLEKHPTFFHLVSTVKGELLEEIKFSDIIKAVFPCGSITGAPKIRTMQIIDELETANRGLSMGAIGCYVPSPKSQVPSQKIESTWHLGLGTWDISVAIRTMVIKNQQAIFNVGGGIVIDSNPESEYEESLIKAQAIFSALGTDKTFVQLLNE